MTPTAVLVHGVGLDRHMWTSFADALDRPSTAYDMLGLGDAPKPDGPYSLSMYAEQLAAFVGERQVDVVGFSMGALVAQRFAIDYPERVRRLVLVSGVFDRSTEERAAIVARVAEVRSGSYADSIEPALARWFTASFADAHTDVVDRVRARMLANDVESYANAYEVFATGDEQLVPLAGRITAPTLVITGDGDERSTPDMAHRLARAIPGARCEIMSGVKHLVPLETPERLADIIGGFLNAEDHHV